VSDSGLGGSDWARRQNRRDQSRAEQADLAAERDYLLRSLRDLEAEHDAGDVAEEDYAALRDTYTARAAGVLRRLEEPEPEPEPESEVEGSEPEVEGSAADPPGGVRAWLAPRRTLVILAGLVVLGVGIGLLAAGGAANRQTGQGVSGSVPLAPAQELQAAQTAMASGDEVTALKLFQAVLRVEPNQPEALAYTGWLLRQAGDAQENTSLVTQGLVAEENAVAADPQYPDAHYFLGVMLLDEAHDPAGAVTQLEAYLALKPPARDVTAVGPILARARAEAATTTTTRPPG
jgi:tetratricopeptide (TPR) repeat protein